MRVPFICAIVGAVACTTDTTPPPVVREDSLGIEIVTSHRSRWSEPQFIVSPEPIVRIGGADDRNASLYGVTRAVVLTDGTIVVANDMGRELLFFSATGDSIATIRRQGSGPGEFRNVTQLIRASDGALGAWDSGLRRLSLYQANAVHIRDILVEHASGYLNVVEMLDSGGFVF